MRKARVAIAKTLKEENRIQRFIRKYPPFKPSTVEIPPGRDLGPMYIVLSHGRRVPNRKRTGNKR